MYENCDHHHADSVDADIEIEPVEPESARFSHLTADALLLYEFAAAARQWSADDASKATGLTASRVEDAIRALCRSCLLRTAVRDPRMWEAVAPEVAMVDLLSEREDRLRREHAAVARAREELRALQPTYLDALRLRMPSATIDIVDDDDRAARLLAEHAQHATSDVAVVNPHAELNGAEWLYLASHQGDHRRSRPAVRLILRQPDNPCPALRRDLELLIGSQGQVRTADDVPPWMSVFDERTAVVAIFRDRPWDGVAVVRHPSVVRALQEMFDVAWAVARPLSAAPPADELRDQLRLDILRHLAAGLKDEVVARRLGLSVRTCRRHIAEIMEQLGATSRFQAGVLVQRFVFTRGAAPPAAYPEHFSLRSALLDAGGADQGRG